MLSRTLVGEILPQRASPTLKENTPFLRILEILKESPHFDLPVLNGDNKLVGMVRFDHLKVIIDVPEMNKLVIAKDIIEPGTVVLLPTDSLKDAIRQFRNTGFNYIPVVKSREHPELIGVLSRMDLLHYYGEEIRSQIE
jgi:CIC family chloride channel protein